MNTILYTSRKILIEGENETFSLVDGGVLVNLVDGKIEQVFTIQSDINNFLYDRPTTIVSKHLPTLAPPRRWIDSYHHQPMYGSM